ncbi:hypothetical protein [Jiangella anatolica]|uniref:Uncharacterized protein n=1 Tax=Jiangella anatolica TaxID=2670374 RepID=A0A2W2C7P8_9ACTN|nr:hypothetical protein [Jiangella anatolica]PZF84239.1 hypothetical protein C1I92_09340 [Jiangella anatolica]
MTSTDTILRSLDPAAADVDPHGPRARADLARILAAPAAPASPAAAPAPPRRRRVRRLVLTAAAVAAAAVGASVLVPSLTGGDRAFATWTATPSAVSAGASEEIADACRDAQRDGAGGFEADLAAATAAVAERRGDWSLALLAGDDGFSALCITDESTPLFRDWIGMIGGPGGYTAPEPRSAFVWTLGTGTVGGGELSVAAGAVGSDVTGMTYDSAEHGVVTATVAAGHFAFWLPGDELENASGDGVPVTVTYADGTTGTLTLRFG